MMFVVLKHRFVDERDSFVLTDCHYYSEEIEMLLTFLGIFLLLFDVQPDDGETNGDQADSAHHHDQVKTSCGRDEKFKAPLERVTSMHKDNKLRVRDNGGPHVLSTFALDACCSIESLHVVIGAAYTQEGERKLKTHVAGLESLGSHSNELVVIHVSDYKAVRCASCVIIVHVVRLLQLRVN